MKHNTVRDGANHIHVTITKLYFLLINVAARRDNKKDIDKAT